VACSRVNFYFTLLYTENGFHIRESDIHDGFDMDMSYTRVLHPKVLHQRTASQGSALCKSQMTSRALRHTAAAMRAHNVLQGTVEQLR
jgi:hypothetical protein